MTGGPPRLLLDEMFSPLLAERLRALGHDVLSVAQEPGLRGRTDRELYEWAGADVRRVVTENVKDFAPLVAAVPEPGVLFTSSRSFRRSRQDPGPLLAALQRWLAEQGSSRSPVEWLQPA